MLSDTKLDYDDVLIVPQRTTTASRKEIEIEREFKFYHSPRVWRGTPIVASNMFATGSFKMSRRLLEQGMVTCLHKFHELNAECRTIRGIRFNPLAKGTDNDYIWTSVGIKQKDLDKLSYIHRAKIRLNICIDVANGYTQDFVDFCKKVRELYPESIIMAGNVCTPNMVEELIINGGVDIVKIGIGPGSVCTTRLVTGVGYPQLSAVMECSHAAHGLKSDSRRLGLICADGGCVHPGDVCKAFCANADFVMLGGMLAGTSECDGEWNYEYPYYRADGSIKHWEDSVNANLSCRPNIKDHGRKHSLRFYGMSSYEAQKEHNGGVKDYRSSEGRVVEVAHKGPVDGVLQEIMGGIRSCCAYIGAREIKDMGKCSDFIRVNNTHNRSMI